MGKGALRLTESKMRDLRFRRTEEMILEAFLAGVQGNTCQVVKKAKISRAAFYCHHRGAGRILTDYREYVASKYARMIRKVLKRERVELRGIFYRTLAFIMKEKKVFLMFLDLGEEEVLRRMIGELEVKIKKTARISKSQHLIFELYRAEIVALIEDWGRNGGFAEERIEEVLGDMMYLTRTIWERLGVVGTRGL